MVRNLGATRIRVVIEKQRTSVIKMWNLNLINFFWISIIRVREPERLLSERDST